jgi:hypothetical protein
MFGSYEDDEAMLLDVIGLSLPMKTIYANIMGETVE